MSDRVTARDVENQEFARKMRGYDPDEVRMFLRTVAEHVEKLTLENGELREEIGQLRVRLEDFRDRERNLQETLLTAQKMSDELKGRSEKEAEVLVKEARLKAERILEQAQDQLQHIEDEIGRLRLERDAFENRLRSAIQEHLSLLDLRRADAGDHESLRFLRRRTGRDAG
jgi:cell division initiation protein